GNFAIMDVAYIWKDMVFDLMVQSACKPVDDFVFGSEIRRSVKLVDGPSVFDFAYFVRYWVCSLVYDMRQLEYDAKDKPCGIMHDEESQKDFPPYDSDNHRKHEPYRYIDNFGDDQCGPKNLRAFGLTIR